VLAWLKRFGLHLAAAVGATGIFVAAAAVGATQTRQQTASIAPSQITVSGTRTPEGERKPTVVAIPAPRRTPAAARVAPERSLAGTVQAVLPDELDVLGIGGREWHVAPAPGALIRLNGKAATLDTFQAGDTVVILGQAETGPGRGGHFLAHAITARRK